MTHKTSLYCSAAISFAAIISSPAMAQDTDTDLETTELTQETEIITVNATRFETPINEVGKSVSVITEEQIETRQHRTVFDALSASPGIQTTRSGPLGTLTTASIRGLPSAQTLFVQDGIVLNDPSSLSNGFNLANFDTAAIEKIEIVRGAQSTLYGSDAIGGVINIVTKGGEEGLSANAYVEGGSFGTFRSAASLAAGNDLINGRITISSVTTSGFSTADEENGNTENDGFDNFTLSSKLSITPTDTLSFDAILRYEDSENEFDGFLFGTGPVDADEIGQTETLTLAGFAHYSLLDGVIENRLGVTYLQNEQVTLSSNVPSFDAQGTRISYEYQATIKPSDQISIIAGIEYEEQESEVTIGFGGNQEIDTTSVFGLLQLKPISFLTVNAGIRQDSSPDFDDQTTFSVSAAAEIPVTQTILRGSYAEGFRAASAGELSFNPDLFSEFSDSWDIGIEQPFFNKQARLSITYFNQNIDDLIAFDLAAFTFVNIQEFSSEGIEVALDATVNEWLSIAASYTHTDAVNVSTNVIAGNQPDDRFTIETSVKPVDRLSLSLGLSYNGSESSGGQILDDFFLVNLRGSFEIIENVEIFARVENLTDENYQDNLGFGTAPASAFAGIKAKF